MACFDECFETDGDDQWKAWLEQVFDAKQEIVDFVSSRRPGTPIGKFDSYLKGSFNFSLCIRFEDGGPKALIRFPKPGHTAIRLRDEKVTNEVHVLRYLRANTTIPIPRVISWGLTEESPHKLGPFIIMDFVEGTRLSNIMMLANEDPRDDVVLDPEIDNAKLDIIYDQIADYMLQLSRLDFSAIGAISPSVDSSLKSWTVRSRPLTYNMNELATVIGYPLNEFPAAPFTTAADYLQYLAKEQFIHLSTQRNLCEDAEDVKKRFIARTRFQDLIVRYCIEDEGPFKLYCDDLQPSNMLVDPETFRITAVIDFEFTNAMPAQFAYDPPWWLLLLGPDMWLERRTMVGFLEQYVPRLNQFIYAMERVEIKHLDKGEILGPLHLSSQMRESWESGRFWFDYGIRKSFDIDAVYWAVLHTEADIKLSDGMLSELAELEDLKMTQLREYNVEVKARFG